MPRKSAPLGTRVRLILDKGKAGRLEVRATVPRTPLAVVRGAPAPRPARVLFLSASEMLAGGR